MRYLGTPEKSYSFCTLLKDVADYINEMEFFSRVEVTPNKYVRCEGHGRPSLGCSHFVYPVAISPAPTLPALAVKSVKPSAMVIPVEAENYPSLRHQ